MSPAAVNGSRIAEMPVIFRRGRSIAIGSMAEWRHAVSLSAAGTLRVPWLAAHGVCRLLLAHHGIIWHTYSEDRRLEARGERVELLLVELAVAVRVVAS